MVKKWAYYNDNDKKKLAWVRELMKAGLITPGEIDERPIQSIHHDDIKGFKRCHFFCGIAIWDYALNLAGWPEDREVWSGSAPCQPFSAAGKREAFNDERHLWPVWFPLIEARRPLVLFGEQTAAIDGLAWLDVVQAQLDGAGYTCGAVDLCAAGFGSPHRRQRLYWVAEYGGLADHQSGGCGEFGDASQPGSGRHAYGSGISGQLAYSERGGRGTGLRDSGQAGIGRHQFADRRRRYRGWASPQARDWKSGETSQDTLDKNARPLSKQAVLTDWKTPCVQNGGRISGNKVDIGKHRDGTKAQIGLENEAKLTGWPTPDAQAFNVGCDLKKHQERLDRMRGEYNNGNGAGATLGFAAQLTAFGDQPIGFLLGRNGWEIVPASGQLNPAHSAWMMGLPEAWDECAIAASRLLKTRKRE